MGFGALANAGGAGLSRVGRPPARPTSIIGRALAAHPAWQSQPARLGGGVGSAGGALLGAGRLTHVPGTTQPAAPQAPAAPPAAPIPTPSLGLDATYYANVGAHQLQTNNQINALNLRDANNLTALQSTLGNLAYQQPRDQLALEQRANQSGGLYSSVEDQNQANLAHSYLGKQTAAQTAYGQAHSSLAAQIAALLQGEQEYETGQGVDAANRAAALAQNNPAVTAPAPPAPPAPAPARAATGGAAPTRGHPASIISRALAGHPNWRGGRRG